MRRASAKRSGCRGAFVALLLAATLLAPFPAASDGALAVGAPPDITKDGFAYGRNVNSRTEAEAVDRALDLCRHVEDSTDTARGMCTIVTSFKGQCVSVAMDPQEGTPGVGWAVASSQEAAEQEALAKCRATAGADRQQFCVKSDSACDGE